MHNRILNLVLCIVLLHAVIPLHVAGQDNRGSDSGQEIGFAIIPVGDHPGGFFDDVEMEPGETRSFEVDLVNISTIEISFDVYVSNSGTTVNGGFVAGGMDEEVIEPAIWIDYEPQKVTLGPEEAMRTSFSVTVPNDASPGQYISAMTMLMQDTVKIEGTDVFEQRLAHSISIGILVPGDMNVSFELGTPEFLEQSRTISIPVINTGNYLVRPTGLLTVTDLEGNELLSLDVQMGSVYAGLTSSVGVAVPEQLQFDEVLVTLQLTDPASGVSARVSQAEVVAAKVSADNALSVESATITPNADDIVFANVEVVVTNSGSQLPSTSVTLVVERDGEEVDLFPLATNQVLINGTNSYTNRYVPLESWEPGTYTFRLEIFSVDPTGGSQVELLNIDLDTEIVVP